MSRQSTRAMAPLGEPRLLSAGAAALLAHGLILVVLWSVIDSATLPSHTHRSLVLTLSPSVADGLTDQAEPSVDTLNDVEVDTAAAAQVSAPAPLPDQTSIRASIAEPNSTMAEQARFDPLTNPSAVAAAAREPDPARANSTFSAEPGHATFEPTAEFIEPNNAQADLIENLALLTGIDSDLLMRARPSTAPSASPAAATISDAQKEMFERKVREWSEQIDLLEGLQEPLSWQHMGREYTAVFRRNDSGGETALEEINVQVSTEQDGKQLTTELRMQRLAFSSFAQFVHRWDPEVMLHNDELDGRFHSNSQINLDYAPDVRPLFRGKVTTTSSRVKISRNRGRATRNKIFLGGLVTGVKHIDMPRPRKLYPDTDASDDVHYVTLDEHGTITFGADGSWHWQPLGEGAPRSGSTIGAPLTFVAQNRVKLSVRGEVLGQVLVYSPSSISITGSLRYATDNDPQDFGDNLLGIVSDRDIRIAAPEVTGPGDLEITAAIYARRRFKVDQYHKQAQGTLKIVGSLSAGSLDATEPRYATRIIFDKRLEKMRPPGFPVTSHYEISKPGSDWQGVPLSRLETPDALLAPRPSSN